MYKQITKEQIKDYPVGTKVLVSGEVGGDQECVITDHYPGQDCGFNVDVAIYTNSSGPTMDLLNALFGGTQEEVDAKPSHVFPNASWEHHTVSVWVDKD